MERITFEQLEKIPEQDRIIADIRSRALFEKGTCPGAVSMPWLNPDNEEDGEEFRADYQALPKNRLICVLCHTGGTSREVAQELEAQGFRTCDLIGGYRAYLRRSLEQAVSMEEDLTSRTAKAERSIIKKYRKQLWSRFTRAVTDYQLIREGDHIAACISGGKDSMLMAKLLQEIQRHGKIRFDLTFLCMNPGYNDDNWTIVQNNAKLLGIPLTVFNSNIFEITAAEPHHPCYLCARMRRGYLYANAKKLGCNKIALGHHYDDVIETILMGILYSGKTETMLPKLHSQNFEGMELIRPLYLIREESICAWRDYNDLHFIQCACRFTEHCASCGGAHASKRDEVKKMIRKLREQDPVIEQNIFNCVRDINLRTILGYHKDGKYYNFLDGYDTE